MTNETKIKNVIYHFANSFDLKDWEGLKNSLAETIVCDYQDLRNIKEECSRDAYVMLRRNSLTELHTQHLFSNLEVDLNGDSAKCRVSALILRKNAQEEIFNTHAIYFFQLTHSNNQWLITYIKQTVLWNDGNPGIHPGVKNSQQFFIYDKF